MLMLRGGKSKRLRKVCIKVHRVAKERPKKFGHFCRTIIVSLGENLKIELIFEVQGIRTNSFDQPLTFPEVSSFEILCILCIFSPHYIICFVMSCTI